VREPRGALLANVTQEAHLRGAVGRAQGGRLVRLLVPEEGAVVLTAWFARVPELLPRVEFFVRRAPVPLSRTTAVRAVNPEIVYYSIR
jgi:hypothetical protein